jgi:diguanylate cyclase (GGDEF)-like protein/PAS domain S-box-containing protein
MSEKPTYEELEQRVKEFEKEKRKNTRIEEEFVKRQKYLESVFHHAPSAIITLDSSHHVLDWNPGAQKIFGYSSEEAQGRDLDDLVSNPEVKQEASNNTLKVLSGQPLKPIESVRYRKDGTSVHVIASGSPIIMDNVLKGVVVLYTDITERKIMESKMQESEQKFRTLFEDSKDAIYITTKEGRFIDFNQAYLKLFGYTKEEMVTIHVKDIYMNSADRDMFKKTIEEKGSVRDYVVKLRRKDGQQMDCIITATTRYAYVDGSISGYQGIIRDVAEQKRLEQQLHTMSLTDELTGLYNRRGFFTLAQQQLKVADRTKKDLLLFFVDLDKMKQINDTLGHQEGDNALVEIATILKEVFRESDIIGRMGGDEFAILAINTTDETGEIFIMRLHNTLDNYNRLEGRNYQLSLSIGIAHYDPETPAALDELMAQADTLMYEEKKRKQN